jgi:flagellar basal-body rod protein FlgG
MYAAASGLEAMTVSQDVTAENLASINQPGYRARIPVYQSFEQVLNQAQPAPAGGPFAPVAGTPQPYVSAGPSLWGVQPTAIYTDYRSGPRKYTGNPFDVAPADEFTYLVVQGPGGPLLTRAGALTLSNLNELITVGGLYVVGQGGRIVIPPTASRIDISYDGFVAADGIQVGQMLLANISNPGSLQRVGNTLFAGPIPQGTPIPGTVNIRQGFLEESNVNEFTGIISLITNLRYYEANQRALRSLSDAVTLNTRPQQA